MENDEIRKKIEECIKLFYENDTDLLDINIHENAVSSRLAQYLSSKFDEYTVDNEYNRHIRGPKLLNGDEIRPDIVIHRRLNDDENLVYMEIKTFKNKKKNDRLKDIRHLQGVTRQNGQFGYQLGVFVDFTADVSNIIIRYFVDGAEWN